MESPIDPIDEKEIADSAQSEVPIEETVKNIHEFASHIPKEDIDKYSPISLLERAQEYIKEEEKREKIEKTRKEGTDHLSGLEQLGPDTRKYEVLFAQNFAEPIDVAMNRRRRKWHTPVYIGAFFAVANPNWFVYGLEASIIFLGGYSTTAERKRLERFFQEEYPWLHVLHVLTNEFFVVPNEPDDWIPSINEELRNAIYSEYRQSELYRQVRTRDRIAHVRKVSRLRSRKKRRELLPEDEKDIERNQMEQFRAAKEKSDEMKKRDCTETDDASMWTHPYDLKESEKGKEVEKRDMELSSHIQSAIDTLGEKDQIAEQHVSALKEKGAHTVDPRAFTFSFLEHNTEHPLFSMWKNQKLCVCGFAKSPSEEFSNNPLLCILDFVDTLEHAHELANSAKEHDPTFNYEICDCWTWGLLPYSMDDSRCDDIRHTHSEITKYRKRLLEHTKDRTEIEEKYDKLASLYRAEGRALTETMKGAMPIPCAHTSDEDMSSVHDVEGLDKEDTEGREKLDFISSERANYVRLIEEEARIAKDRELIQNQTEQQQRREQVYEKIERKRIQKHRKRHGHK
jgi:hypothetical protein